MNQQLREFGEDSANRNNDLGKYDYEAFFSPEVLERRAKYMHKHRHLEDGSMREGDNWQMFFGEAHTDVCMKSMFRHFHSLWKAHRGVDTDEDIEDSLAAIMFNCEAYLLWILKKK